MSEQVKTMFSKISSKYDTLNTVLSFGIHHLWRRKVVRLSEAKSGDYVLDCASGTGDLAIAFKKKVGSEGRVLGTDFCPDMLKYAAPKAEKQNLDIEFEIADATDLQFESNQFNISSISFGIRNVDSPKKCLEEMSRVVKSNGKVIVLEFGQPTGLFASLYSFYSKYIIPTIGKMFLSDNSAYVYLPETAAKFPCKEKFIDMMEETNCFQTCSYKTLSLGIAYIYIGIVK